MPRPLYARERGTVSTVQEARWTSLDGRGKSLRHRQLVPGLSSRQRVAIPTELSRPTVVWRSELNVSGPGLVPLAEVNVLCP
jgi:hypothetical protein